MRLRTRISDQARVNTLEIWNYIAEHDIDAADSVVAHITNTFGFLANNPNAGRSRDDLRPGIRSYPVKQYLVFYFPFEDTIVISRIVHGNRDLVALFESESYDTFRMTNDDTSPN